MNTQVELVKARLAGKCPYGSSTYPTWFDLYKGHLTRGMVGEKLLFEVFKIRVHSIVYSPMKDESKQLMKELGLINVWVWTGQGAETRLSVRLNEKGQ